MDQIQFLDAEVPATGIDHDGSGLMDSFFGEIVEHDRDLDL